MRQILIISFLLLNPAFVFGQDGSDMNYLKPEALNESHIGRRLHLDFYRWSRGIRRGEGFNIDKVSLEINGKQFEFVEHREDDGFNNWFSGQYLETADKKVRLKEFKLLGVEKETILVVGYFNISSRSNRSSRLRNVKSLKRY
jgi:hypothetical protein